MKRKGFCILLSFILVVGPLMACSGSRSNPEKNNEGGAAARAATTTTTRRSAATASPSPRKTPSRTATATPRPTPTPPDSVFAPTEPKKADAVIEAAAWVRKRVDAINDTGVPVPDAGDFSTMFYAANAEYREGNYAEAKTIYLDLLDSIPGHSGGMNNLALTFIQLEDYESALQYCILNRVLNPGFYAGWINLVVAGHALGFRPAELQTVLSEELDEFPSIFAHSEQMESDFPDQDAMNNVIMLAYLYNVLYADMEHEPVMSGAKMENLDRERASGKITEAEYTKTLLDMYLSEIESALNNMVDKHPEDEDAILLMEYYKALSVLRNR